MPVLLEQPQGQWLCTFLRFSPPENEVPLLMKNEYLIHQGPWKAIFCHGKVQEFCHRNSIWTLQSAPFSWNVSSANTRLLGHVVGAVHSYEIDIKLKPTAGLLCWAQLLWMLTGFMQSLIIGESLGELGCLFSGPESLKTMTFWPESLNVWEFHESSEKTICRTGIWKELVRRLLFWAQSNTSDHIRAKNKF